MGKPDQSGIEEKQLIRPEDVSLESGRPEAGPPQPIFQKAQMIVRQELERTGFASGSPPGALRQEANNAPNGSPNKYLEGLWEHKRFIEGVIKQHLNRYHYRGDYDLIINDLTQDVFLLAIKNMDSFKGTGQITSWLYTIVQNRCAGFLQRKIFRDKSLDRWQLDPSVKPDEEDNNTPEVIFLSKYFESEYKTTLDKIIEEGKLDEIDIEVFILRGQGLKNKEIFQKLKRKYPSLKTLAAIKSRLHRTKEIIKKIMKGKRRKTDIDIKDWK